MRAAPPEVRTNDRGEPRNVTPEMFVEKCVRQGRIHPDDRSYWLYKFSQDEDAAANELLARRPVRALADGRSTTIGDDAYRAFAQQVGLLPSAPSPADFARVYSLRHYRP